MRGLPRRKVHQWCRCERVQFVSGIVAEEEGLVEAAHAAWSNATRAAGGTWAQEGQALLLSYGVNDCEARVARISLSHVRRLLRPLSDSSGTVCVPQR